MSSENANCLADNCEFLVASSQRQVIDSVHEDEIEVDADPQFDHEYFNRLVTLTPYVQNVVEYISGFVIKKSFPETCLRNM